DVAAVAGDVGVVLEIEKRARAGGGFGEEAGGVGPADAGEKVKRVETAGVERATLTGGRGAAAAAVGFVLGAGLEGEKPAARCAAKLVEEEDGGFVAGIVERFGERLEIPDGNLGVGEVKVAHELFEQRCTGCGGF